jgi:hypothetical protein
VNSSGNEWTLGISVDGLAICIASDRAGGYGSLDIWVTRRATVSDDWGAPVNLGPRVNSSSLDGYPITSADGRILYFTSNRPGGAGGIDMWQAEITPILDFDGDGIVGSADMRTLVNHWHTDNVLYDIAPLPFGDSFVDVQDLVFLSEHLFEEIDDPTLTTHWTLDEAEGAVAYDSAAVNDAVVFGDPVWQPTGGAVDGALEFDGMDDYVSTPFVLNPTEGVFSIFAWIKGGAADQVIISQPEGANWLMTDQEGRLLTELGMIARVGPLRSQEVITDGQWYRIGFVWDGMCRALYVDDILVAEDTVGGLAASSGGLYIGVGKDLAPGTYFSGLIDDVRVYDRAVRP